MLQVADIDHVQDAAHGNSLAPLNIKNTGKDFIAYEDVILVTKDRVRPRQPTVSIKLVVVEVKLTYQLGFFRAATLDSVAHIQNDQAIAPVSQIRQTVLHLQVVQVAAVNGNSFFGLQAVGDVILYFPARDLFRIFDVGEIDDAHRSGR